jgi:hypothetical protein
MVLRPGEQEAEGGLAVLYHYDKGQINRSVEMPLSESPANIRRILHGKLYDGNPAVFVASFDDKSAIVTDVLTLRDKESKTLPCRMHLVRFLLHFRLNYYTRNCNFVKFTPTPDV